MKAILVLGNQLFDPALLSRQLEARKGDLVFLREDRELCTYFRFHQHKLVFFLAAMRHYADELRAQGLRVHYQKLGEVPGPYEAALERFLDENAIQEIRTFEVEDKFFEARLGKQLAAKGRTLTVVPSPMFLTTREEFQRYLQRHKRPYMKEFYQEQRQRLDILMEGERMPKGGRWSFDDENRLALPKTVTPPPLSKPVPSPHVQAVVELVAREFPDHPGRAQHFWLPVDRSGARAWLAQFLCERLKEFGPYEDALAPNSDFVFHSVLTPFLNTGLLTPAEVIDETLRYAKKHRTPLPSLEGFVRQVIGWREFIRGIYQNFDPLQQERNFWRHEGKLTSHWYSGTTGVPPLDNSIQKAQRFAYTHHIERLMVVGNLMLLSGVHPQEAYRWFMEMYLDSSDWVMGPNVFGMALFSDGGIFATKPYICGSNYYRKMGGHKSGDWCDGVDGLYWSFVEKNRSFFLKNPRLAMAARTVEKMDPARKTRLFKAAEKLRSVLVQ